MSAAESLLGLFLERYADLRYRLRRRLGSDDVIDDVLQETYLRVERLDGTAVQVRNPIGYLWRMALNIAADQRLAESRYLTGDEVEALLHIGDDALDPARVTMARMEVAELERALHELSPRQQAIVIAARVDEIPLPQIARQHRISVRMVGKELKRALALCGERLDRRVVQRFGPGAGGPSA